MWAIRWHMCRRRRFHAKSLPPSIDLDPKKQWIALLPGSRRKEVRLNLPVMLQAAQLCRNKAMILSLFCRWLPR